MWVYNINLYSGILIVVYLYICKNIIYCVWICVCMCVVCVSFCWVATIILVLSFKDWPFDTEWQKVMLFSRKDHISDSQVLGCLFLCSGSHGLFTLILCMSIDIVLLQLLFLLFSALQWYLTLECGNVYRCIHWDSTTLYFDWLLLSVSVSICFKEKILQWRWRLHLSVGIRTNVCC